MSTTSKTPSKVVIVHRPPASPDTEKPQGKSVPTELPDENETKKEETGSEGPGCGEISKEQE